MGGGEVPPALLKELEKSALILGKNALIAMIHGLKKLSFKVQFLEFLGEKTGDLSLRSLSFSCCRRLFIEVL